VADSNSQLDQGFDEVPLDEGFKEVPLEAKPKEEDKSLVEKALGAISSPKIGKSLSGGLNSAIESTGDAAAGAAEGASQLVGGVARVGATAATARDLAKEALNGDVNFLPDPKKWKEYQDASAKGDIDKLPAVMKWQTYQKMIKDKQNEIAERSPLAYPIGEGLGTLATAPLIPELGGEKAISMAGKASPALDQFLAGNMGGIAGKVAGKATAGAIEGAPIGGIMGATGSEASSPEEFAKDVGSGMGMGSAGGLALGAGLGLVKGTAEAASNIGNQSDYVQKAKQMYALGKDQNVNLSTTSGKDIASLMSNRDIPNDIVNNWLAVDDMNGKKVGATIQQAMDSGTKINIDNDLHEATKNLFGRFLENPNLQDLIDPKSKQVISLIYKNEGGDVTPLEAKAIRDTLYDLSGKLNGMGGEVAPAVQRQGNALAKAIDGSLKAQVPGYQDAAQKFSEFRSMIPETVLQPGVPLDKRTQYLGDLKNKKSDLLGATKDLVNQAQMPGDQPARAGLAELQQNMQQLKMTNPQAYQGIGGDNAFQNLRDKSNLIAGMNQAQGVNPNETAGKAALGVMSGGGQGLGLNIANKLGRAAKITGQSGPVQIGTRLYSATNEQLMNLATSLKGSPATKLLGDSLERALGQKTDTLKNAVLFRMLQDPTYRGMLKELGFESGYGSDSVEGTK
jgi:hypothetical protein